jgi:cytoskeletal protein RodZ
MEHVDQQSVEQDATIIALRVQLGGLLSRERLGQQKDVLDVARRLMLSKLQLLAIEAGEASSFHHERRYIQGIKAYVFYLGLQSRAEVNELVTQIENWSADSLRASPAAGVAQLHRSAAAPTPAKSYASRGPRYVYVGLGVLVLGAIALALSEGWPFKDETQENATAGPAEVATTTTVVTPLSSPQVRSVSVETPPVAVTQSSAGSAVSTQTPTQISSPAPLQPQALPQVQAGVSQDNVPAKAVKPVAAQDGKAMMRINFNAECWVSLQTADGKKVDRIYKSGETLSVPLASVAALVLGNAPAAKVFLADRQVDVMAKGITYGNVTRLDQKGIQLLQKN